MGVFLILLIIGLIIFFIIYHNKKKLRLADVTMITGGVKTGKTTLTMHLARRKFRWNKFKWFIKNFFTSHLFGYTIEKPLFYSNVPVKWSYVPVTEDILLRKVRINYKSVMVLQEASLIADSMDYKDFNINEDLKLFNKLYGHETKGGSLYYDTQCVKDVHFSVKRSLNTYIWIQSAIKFIPFFYVVNVREMYYADEEGVINTFDSDVEDNTKWIIITKRIWKYFDCYCYSVLTDNLPVENRAISKGSKDLKARQILRLGGKRKKCDLNTN